MASSNVSVKTQTVLSDVVGLGILAKIHAFADLTDEGNTLPAIFKADIIQAGATENSQLKILRSNAGNVSDWEKIGTAQGCGNILGISYASQPAGIQGALTVTRTTLTSCNQYSKAVYGGFRIPINFNPDDYPDDTVKIILSATAKVRGDTRYDGANSGQAFFIGMRISTGSNYPNGLASFIYKNQITAEGNGALSDISVIFEAVINKSALAAVPNVGFSCANYRPAAAQADGNPFFYLTSLNVIAISGSQEWDYDSQPFSINGTLGKVGELLLSYDGTDPGYLDASGNLIIAPKPEDIDRASRYGRGTVADGEDLDMLYDGPSAIRVVGQINGTIGWPTDVYRSGKGMLTVGQGFRSILTENVNNPNLSELCHQFVSNAGASLLMNINDEYVFRQVGYERLPNPIRLKMQFFNQNCTSNILPFSENTHWEIDDEDPIPAGVSERTIITDGYYRMNELTNNGGGAGTRSINVAFLEVTPGEYDFYVNTSQGVIARATIDGDGIIDVEVIVDEDVFNISTDRVAVISYAGISIEVPISDDITWEEATTNGIDLGTITFEE